VWLAAWLLQATSEARRAEQRQQASNREYAYLASYSDSRGLLFFFLNFKFKGSNSILKIVEGTNSNIVTQDDQNMKTPRFYLEYANLSSQFKF
jgi:hypothetical protein